MRAALVSAAKFLVTPWVASFRAAVPLFSKTRKFWRAVTSAPVMPSWRSRVKVLDAEPEPDGR